MSWFNMNAIKELKDKVQAAIPIDREMLAKLTLTTPEMNAERQQIYEDERRKAAIKNSLAGMLPWETNDEERDILVEECKEAILALSSKVETFFGPYELPALAVKVEDDVDEDEEEEEEDDQEKEVEIDKNQKPSPESLVKLEKLEPLPPLLSNFDLDAHVGLIERMLKVDPELVEMQSMLSGGGEREKLFWRNYFFHCAFTRYEAGLSIDEIWSDQPSPRKQRSAASTDEKGIETTNADAESETTIVFENPDTKAANPTETAFSAGPEKTLDFGTSSAGLNDNEADINSTKESVGNDFELVAGNDDSVADAELDELEAEIARELED